MLPGWNYALWFVVVRYSSRLNYFSTACVIRSVEVRHARGQQSTASVIGPANYPDYGRSSLPGAQLASGLRAVGHFAGLLAADSRLRRAWNDLRQFSEKPQPQRASGHLRGLHRSEEHTSELQSLTNLVCRLLL